MSDASLTDNPISFLLQRGNDSLKSAEALIELDLTLDGLSRAYYAALHYARALLLSIDVVPKSHKGALTLFSLHFIKSGIIPKEIGVIFSILQKIREDSDYEIGTYYDKNEALRLLDDTRLFCTTVAEVLKK
ncbi:HEPN domain-containing protein [Geotalea uraniireducens]|uniref:HEPN domain protein n=1 Tax=Geotalea uraniireducens (strain Rf4) TaxID=351605 RepID=A5GAJ5_GEOUR|nr:HEPN domain-containing protein [Geotalea uraniireducens]ABQ25403.1 HEPN domain protein [Geotalea uraniireducens Rf4]